MASNSVMTKETAGYCPERDRKVFITINYVDDIKHSYICKYAEAHSLECREGCPIYPIVPNKYEDLK